MSGRRGYGGVRWPDFTIGKFGPDGKDPNAFHAIRNNFEHISLFEAVSIIKQNISPTTR